jgi:KipI family sensor histidine kinase inhibitor
LRNLLLDLRGEVGEKAAVDHRLVGDVREERSLIAIVHGRNVIIERGMQIAAAGDRGLLATFADASPSLLRSLAAAVRRDANVIACVVGHESLLAIFREAPDASVFEREVESELTPPVTHRVRVTFDGVDLDELLAHAQLTRDEFLTRVDGLKLTVRYLGFRAGFAYLDGWPWQLPRRPTSRTRVARGTFAVAGAMAGFYPVDSPGGWNLLGRTDAPLWDPEREPPNLFAPGDVVVIDANR